MIKKVINLGLTSLLIFTAVFFVANDPLYACDTKEACDTALEEIANQKNDILNKIAANQNDTSNLREQLEFYADQIKLVEEEMAMLEQTIVVLEQQRVELDEKISVKKVQVQNRMLVQQKNNNENSYLMLLLSSTSFTDFIQRMAALNTLQVSDKQRMIEFAEEYQEVVELKQAQTAKGEELENAKIELEQTQAQRTELLATLRAEMQTAEAQLEGLTTSEADLQHQRDLINMPIPDEPTPPTSGSGSNGGENNGGNESNDGGGTETETPPTPSSSWHLPVGSGAVVTTLFLSEIYHSEFGSWHYANDIGDYRGSPIYAAASGRVLYSDDFCYEGNKSCNGGFGNLVVLSHRDVNGRSYVTLYAHLNSTSVNVGDYVYGGNQIGAMGNTGGSYGAHLHLEVLADTETIDFSKAFRSARAVNPLSLLPYEGYWSIRWDA